MTARYHSASVVVSSGQTVSGAHLAQYHTATVLSGGTILDTVIDGGKAYLYGSASHTSVGSGGFLELTAAEFGGGTGGMATDTVVGSLGLAQIFEGELLSSVVQSGGLEIVGNYKASAVDVKIQNGGSLTITADGDQLGSATYVSISSGGLVTDQASIATATVKAGGQLALQPSYSENAPGYGSPVMSDVTVQSGGLLAVLPNFDYPVPGVAPATAENSEIKSGATVVAVDGETITGLTIDQGATVVAATVVDYAGNGKLLAYGTTVSGLTITSGQQESVYSGGTAVGTTLFGGSSLFRDPGDEQLVYAGGTAIDTTVGLYVTELVSGTSIRTTVEAGGYEYLSSGVASDTIVSAGGALGGKGAAYDTVVEAGGEVSVDGSMRTVDTVLNGGTETIGNGANAQGTTIMAGGTQILAGATPAHSPYPFARDTVIEAGGTEMIDYQGSSLAATIESGGDQSDIYGLASGSIIDSGGLLTLADAASATAIVISQGGAVDFSYLPFAAGATASVTSQDVLVVDAGGRSARLQLAGDYAGATFSAARDSGGNTVVTRTQAAAASSFTPTSSSVSSGQVLSGATLAPGTHLYVLAGGTAVDTIFTTNDHMVLYGTAIDTFVQSGGIGMQQGVAANTTLAAGGDLDMEAYSDPSGALARNTGIYSGGELFNDGGTAISTTVHAGGELRLDYDGVASGSVISSGGLEVVFSGQSSNSVVERGGVLEFVGSDVNPPNTRADMIGGTIQAGAMLALLANPFAPTSFVASNTELHAGGTLLFTPGASITGLTVDSGVRVSSATVTVLSGDAILAAGNSLKHQQVGPNTLETVYSGGSASDTMLSGGTIYGKGPFGSERVFGVQQIAFGGVASTTTIANDGTQQVFGIAVATTVLSGGEQQLAEQYFSGATPLAYDTMIESGGTQYVYFGTVSGSTVLAGGTQTLDGLFSDAIGAILSGGAQSLDDFARAAFTQIDSGGVQTVEGDAFALSTQIGAGGKQIVSGPGTGAGIASSTVISAQGDQLIEGGSAVAATILSGGLQQAANGLAISSLVESGGTLRINAGSATDITISIGGTIDYPTVAFVTGASANINAQDLLTVHDGGSVLTLQLQGSYSGDQFQVARDANGGTYVILSAAAAARQTAAADILPHDIAADPPADLPAPAAAAASPHSAALEAPLLPLHH